MILYYVILNYMKMSDAIRKFATTFLLKHPILTYDFFYHFFHHILDIEKLYAICGKNKCS